MANSGTRRVVTGTSADGRSIIASDTLCRPMTVALMPGGEFISLWGGDQTPVYPDSGALPAYHAWFPAVDGFRLEEISIPPDSSRPPADLDIPAAVTEVSEKLPGLLTAMEPAHPGMHRTDTIDFVYVMSGRCVLELDDGVKVALEPGDVVVQNGTRHAWRVPYPGPCRVLSISIGAIREG